MNLDRNKRNYYGFLARTPGEAVVEMLRTLTLDKQVVEEVDRYTPLIDGIVISAMEHKGARMTFRERLTFLLTRRL